MWRMRLKKMNIREEKESKIFLLKMNKERKLHRTKQEQTQFFLITEKMVEKIIYLLSYSLTYLYCRIYFHVEMTIKKLQKKCKQKEEKNCFIWRDFVVVL